MQVQRIRPFRGRRQAKDDTIPAVTESFFFQDLAVLMAVVGLVTIVFTRLRWPKVIGYLFAGILLSEHTWGGSLLADAKSITTIGQLGIVFLMFTLGLEFSAGDMKKVKHVTIPTALFDTVMMIWLGYTVGTRILGWNSVQSLFLGAAVCDSATTLLAKTIETNPTTAIRTAKSWKKKLSVTTDIVSRLPVAVREKYEFFPLAGRLGVW